MSATLATLADRVRQLMNDTDPDDYAVSSPKLWRALVSKAWEWAPRFGYGETWQTALFTTSNSGSTDFTAASGTVYGNVAHLKRASDGYQLKRESRDTIEAWHATIPQSTGKPSHYYLFESTAQRLTARFYPRPNESDTIDAMITVVPAESAIATDTINFSPQALDGLARCVASGIIDGMTDEQRAARVLSPDFSRRLYADGEGLKEAEIARQSRLKRMGGVAVAWRG